MGDSEHPAPWRLGGYRYWTSLYLQAPRDEVFAYLTQGEHTAKYYFAMPICDPKSVGDEVWFGRSPEGSPITGRVTAFDEPALFAHTFSFAHVADEPESTVEFHLYERGPELTVLLVHYHGFDSPGSATLADICGGWPAILSALKTMLETGEALRFPEPTDSPPNED